MKIPRWITSRISFLSIALIAHYSQAFAQSAVAPSSPGDAPPAPVQPDAPEVPTTRGLVGGVMLIPFKVQLHGTHDIAGSASGGGYFGWNIPLFQNSIESQPFDVTPIGFAGLSNLDISTVQANGQETSGAQLAVSAGTGIIISIPSTKFQGGVVLGWDFTTKSYQYDGCPWISFEIGYNFLNPK